ncbi:MAG: endolytic transglycosylase MltG [Nitrospinota bacterium]|nr:endolytic transglycosylase MltG [Nitrospinota bacterium]
MKKLAALAVGLALAGVAGYLWFDAAATRPGWREGYVLFEARRGESARAVGRRLMDDGAIRSAMVFEMEVRRAGGEVKAGEYRFAGESSIRQIARLLISGKTWARPVTIREGLTIAQVAEELEKAGVAPAMEFISTASDVATRMRQKGFPGASLEGYLFPETYHFAKSTPVKTVVETMLSTFRRKAAQALPEEAMADPLRLHQLVTMASIIEKETGAGFERPLISAVFHNRLKIGMPLQSDPTVIYSLPDFDGNIRKKDLSYDSPYNTYRYRGLPPGPIANPGIDSLSAAWAPAPVDYLYFVSKNNGEHYFSKSLQEHNKAVLTFQIRPGRK